MAACLVVVVATTPGVVYWSAVTVAGACLAVWLVRPPDTPALPWLIHPYVHAVVVAAGIIFTVRGLVIADRDHTTVTSALVDGMPYLIGTGILVLYLPGVIMGVAMAVVGHRPDPEDQADQAEDTPEVIDHHTWRAGSAASDAGWWAGYDAYGPGYTRGPVHHHLNPRTWPAMPDVPEGPVVDCPECGTTTGIGVLWLESRPELAQFVCSGCQHAWRDPSYARAEILAHLVEEARMDNPARGMLPSDVAPEVAYQAEMIRREAGNTPEVTDHEDD